MAASGVEVRDQVPKGTQTASKPTPSRLDGARGELVWTLGTIEPGEEPTVEMQLMPIDEGEIGSVATVRFDADASVRSRRHQAAVGSSTYRPQTGHDRRRHDAVDHHLNPGSGVATGVVLEEHVPAGLQHPAGRSWNTKSATSGPNESHKLELDAYRRSARRDDQPAGRAGRRQSRRSEGTARGGRRAATGAGAGRSQQPLPGTRGDLRGVGQQSRHGPGPRRASWSPNCPAA